MDIPTEEVVYRLRKFHRKGDRPEKYRGSLAVFDDRSEKVMASCDLMGRAVFSTLEIVDDRQQVWQMQPNRKIMPTRWTVTDPEGRVILQFDQKIAGKLVHPLYRVALALLDGEGREVYRIVDPRANVPDRIFGLGPGHWAVISGDRLMAKIVWQPREGRSQSRGVIGWVKNFLATADRALVSTGGSHLLPAPVALAMLMIFIELTDASGG